MKKDKRYKIIIGILLLVVLFQWLYILISISKPKRPAKVYIKPKAKIAIVLDDWGYNLNNLTLADEIRYPLTCSILPNLKYSSAAARQLHARGFEIILHLPLQPAEKYNLEKNTITVSLDDKSILNIIDRDLASITYAKGVSNHMGSLATQDRRIMATVFKELKKRRLYFLDSLVSSKSICADLAKEYDLRFARRDVFLDNKQDPEYIKGQLRKLKAKAIGYGYAIGIGHDRRSTLEVLKEVMPEMEKEGYKFVFVSELVR
ncbi:MAG: divergent polysaccharide deacetylase family protein [Candidatus Omnitrophica bacterium]|nr:divergent polysaccharide deacetylase family protein [Candidatus Omnitrophota bacterium]